MDVYGVLQLLYTINTFVTNKLQNSLATVYTLNLLEPYPCFLVIRKNKDGQMRK